MKLGLGSYSLAWAIGVGEFPPENPVTPAGVVVRAAGLGLRLVQFEQNLPLGAASREELAALHAAAVDKGVEIELGTRGTGRDHLLRQLEVCAVLESRVLCVGVETAEEIAETDEIVARIGAVASDFEAAGVRLALENSEARDTAATAGVVRQSGSAMVGMCLDPAVAAGALESPEAALEAAAPYVFCVRIRDFVVRRPWHGLGLEFGGAPAGQGRLDIPRLVRLVGANGLAASAIVELWADPEPSMEETIAKEEQWLEESVQYLRPLIPE